MKRFYLSFVLFMVTFVTIAVAQTSSSKSTGLSIWFNHPVPVKVKTVLSGAILKADTLWERQAFPLGNSNLGASILSSVSTDQIVLNEKSLWKGGPNSGSGAESYWQMNPSSAPYLNEIRKAFLNQDSLKADFLTKKHFKGIYPYAINEADTSRFGYFTMMGECYISTEMGNESVSHFRRSLSLDSALCSVSFEKDGVYYKRTYFVSYPDQVMIMKFAADVKGKQNLTLNYLPNPDATGKISLDGYNGLLYTAALNNNGLKYAVRIRVEHRGGALKIENGKIVVKGANEVTFYLTAATDYRMNFNPDFSDPLTYTGPDPKPITKERLERALLKGYMMLLKRHVADYTSLFKRVKLELNLDEQTVDIPTNERLDAYRGEKRSYSSHTSYGGNAHSTSIGKPDFYLETLYYQFGRYLAIAGSRGHSLPTNLQGLWSKDIYGPWHVDYHNNINIQMNYWPICSTNLKECEQPLVDYIRLTEKPGRITANKVFGTGGWTTSISSNPFGFTAPLDSEGMTWNLCPMAGPWLATHLWEYYDYTRNMNFLRKIAYPLIKGSADFAAGYLWKQPNGIYTAAPSTSPEHGPIDKGATFVHAVIREVLSEAIRASIALNVDAKERLEWQSVLSNLAPYRIGRYGQLMEWSEDIDNPKDEHRHVNHLFGVYPGSTISPITTPELAQAAKVVLEHRGDFATGWSMGWKINQWAHLLDGNHAYLLLGNLLKTGTLDNLWDSHPPFQIDGNFGGTSGMTEMLLQSNLGFIHLLPALPDAWKNGKITGLCARGNFVVDIAWGDGQLTTAVIHSKSGVECSLRYGKTTLTFPTVKGRSYTVKNVSGKLIRLIKK